MEITDTLIEEVLTNFRVALHNYEIINLREYQGWSTAFLYLINTDSGDYILKAKYIEQTKGYQEEYLISELLTKNGFLVRKPIVTKDNKLFFVTENIHWCLLTYLPGAAAHLEEYTKKTVNTFAKQLSRYILMSLNNKSVFDNIKLPFQDPANLLDPIKAILGESRELSKIIPHEVELLKNWVATFSDVYLSECNRYRTLSIIHNDINPKNVLIDHTSKTIISLIDWDHVAIGSPMKDIFDTIAMFYDHLTPEKATQFEQEFLSNINSDILKNTNIKQLETFKHAYYSKAKWSSIMFYFNLYKKYGNQYGEETRYLNEIETYATRWKTLVINN